MKKTIIAMSLTTVFASTAVYAAPLPNGAVLSIDAGSNFAMGGGAYGTVPLLGHKGLVVNSMQGDFGSGSHGGVPVVSDIGAVTQPWNFFNNTGYDFISTNGSGSFSGDTASGVDMTAWTVTWNGIANIPMGGCNLVAGGCTQGTTVFNDTGIGTFSWNGTDGGNYTIDYQAHVPIGDPSNFGGVQYNLHLTGTVTFATSLPANIAPVAVDDNYVAGTTASGVVLGKVTVNDHDDGPGDAVDVSSVDLDPATAGQQTSITTPLGGTLSVDAMGVLTYTAQGTNTGTDTIPYTVTDFRGPTTSNQANINIVVGNIAPVANDDGPAFLNLDVATNVQINVLTNDTDANGNNTIDPTTVDLDPATAGQQTTVTTANGGTATVDTAGVVTYTPPASFLGLDTFQYTVMDNDSSPLVSNAATVSVIVAQGAPIPEYLLLKTGAVSDINTKPAAGDGSWFSMETSPGVFTYTPITGYNGLHLYTKQDTATTAGTIVTDIDEAWTFFGNQGVDRTIEPVNLIKNDGAGNVLLSFTGWNVSWNGIPAINMSTGAAVTGFDNGIAQVTCSGTCLAGETYTLEYSATVPAGDPSGFGGVNYFLHLEGTVSNTGPFVGGGNAGAPYNIADIGAVDGNASGLTVGPGSTATSVGNTTGTGLTAAQTGVVDPLLNPNDGTQCLGGCVDYAITGVTTNYVDVVYHLSTPIMQGSSYRKLINGRWKNFDTTGNDQLGSAVDDGSGNCQTADGIFFTGLRQGNNCVFMRIYDGGPNDADGVKNGTILDPGGVLISGSPNVPASGTSGCSISNVPVKLTDRADWVVVAIFIALFGLVRCGRNARR